MQYIGRIPIIALGKFRCFFCLYFFFILLEYAEIKIIRSTGTIVHGSIVIYMLFWRPHPENPLVFFAMAGLWGVGDAVWQTQMNG